MHTTPVPTRCFRKPIDEIFEAARLLDAAVTAHTMGRCKLAEELIRLADMPVIAEWSNSIWGPGGPWSRPYSVDSQPPYLPKDERGKSRMPSVAQKASLIARDGYCCRLCRIPLVRKETREAIQNAYPAALRWGDRNKNAEQHTAFQAMWLQYDHAVPHSRGGTSDSDNMLITCAPCNYGRWHFTFAEVALIDPREHDPIPTAWDGLERFHR